MLLKPLFALFALFAVSSVYADIQEEDNVLVLTEENFDAAIAANELILVEFYAPWCGHCKTLAPHYAKAAATLKKADPPVPLAKVDATEQKELGSRFDVKGFPTLKWFRNGKATEYEGGRTEAEIVQWVTKKSGPVAKVITTAAEASAIEEKSEISVFGVFASEDSAEHKAFLSAAGGIDDANFAVSFGGDVASKYGVSAPAVVLIKKFDEGRNNFSGDFNVAALTAFVKGNSMPLVSEFSQATSAKIFGGEVTSHFLVFVDKSASHYDEALSALRSMAAEYKGRLLAVVIPSTEDRVMNYFGFKKADLPKAVAVNMAGQMKKYIMDAPLTADAMKTHAEAYFAGSLKAHLKSASVPAESHDGHVRVLVGSNFNAAMNADTDLFVEFYAPWCGHCKSLAPKWEELAAEFKDNKAIVIAKVDATENEVDVPGIEVQGFPTLFFIPAGGSPMKYNGARETADMAEFVRKNSKKAASHDEL